ncbi:MAG: 4Fe-4S binding protein [Dehalococcoidia bacterium]|jgi:ferredoxin
MCEFCHKHGEGKIWYKQASNYSEDLLSDIRRREFVKEFFLHPEKILEDEKMVLQLNRLPSFIRAIVMPFAIGRQKRTHYGQVVPIEDIDHVLGFVNSVTRLPCICRQVTVGSEQRYCYGFSMVPHAESQMGQMIRSLGAEYLTGPSTSGLEELSREEAAKSIRDLEKKGCCHTVWTFMTPFIGGFCNCDRADCMAMKATVTLNFPVIFRAEYVALVEPDLCNGCRQCMRACQFGAMGYSIAHNKVTIDASRCYGCGICRSSCTKEAIKLSDRSRVALAAGLW